MEYICTVHACLPLDPTSSHADGVQGLHLSVREWLMASDAELVSGGDGLSVKGKGQGR